MTPEQLIKDLDSQRLLVVVDHTNNNCSGITGEDNLAPLTEVGFQIGHLGVFTSDALKIIGEEIDRRNDSEERQ